MMLKQSASLGMLLLGTLLSSAHGSRQASTRWVIANATPSSPSPTVVLVATGSERTHSVQAGETLWGIARQYGVNVDELARLNKQDHDAVIRIGDQLRLPAGSESKGTPLKQGTPGSQHKVSDGETLYAIARKYRVDLENLKRTNGISDPNTLQVGQSLTIPGPSKSPSAPGPVSSNERREVPAATAPPKTTETAEEEPPPPPSHEESTVPSKREFAPYQVQKGDTLETIASTYGITTEDLLRINGRAPNEPFAVRVGQRLTVPTDGSWYVPQARKTGTAPAEQTAKTEAAASPVLQSKPEQRLPRTETMLITHVVAPNDDLDALAKRFNTTVDQIRLENPGIRSNRDLRVGAELKIRVTHSL